MSNHQRGERHNSYLDIALKENELLRKQLREQEEEYVKYNDYEKKEFAALKKSSDLLRMLYLAEQPVTKSQLRNLGFDFGLATRTCIIGDQQFLVILDMCYRLEAETITIKPFQP